MHNKNRLTAKTVWLPEYSRLAHVDWANNDCVHISNVRNFRYPGLTEFLAGWEERTYQLSELIAVDLIMSYWSGNMIAHVFLSFGFRNGEWLAISIETRRRINQTWSAFGGFWHSYPVIYVVADERDLIGVRSDIRRERVWLYPLLLTHEQCRDVLRDYLLRVEQTNAHPEWYHTLWNNCTTNILRHGQTLSPGLKYDWRILLSGYADRYCYRKGLLDRRVQFEALRRRCRLRRPPDSHISPGFSQQIRAGR